MPDITDEILKQLLAGGVGTTLKELLGGDSSISTTTGSANPYSSLGGSGSGSGFGIPGISSFTPKSNQVINTRDNSSNLAAGLGQTAIGLGAKPAYNAIAGKGGGAVNSGLVDSTLASGLGGLGAAGAAGLGGAAGGTMGATAIDAALAAAAAGTETIPAWLMALFAL